MIFSFCYDYAIVYGCIRTFCWFYTEFMVQTLEIAKKNKINRVCTIRVPSRLQLHSLLAILTLFPDLFHLKIRTSLNNGHIWTIEASNFRDFHWLGSPANKNNIFPLYLYQMYPGWIAWSSNARVLMHDNVHGSGFCRIFKLNAKMINFYQFACTIYEINLWQG